MKEEYVLSVNLIGFSPNWIFAFVLPLTWTEGNQKQQPNQNNEENPPAHVDCLTDWEGNLQSRASFGLRIVTYQQKWTPRNSTFRCFFSL